MTVNPQEDYESQLETIDLNINVGPQHPATHGVFRMVLEVDGELVTNLVPNIGYMHRGGEKLSENMDYRQAIGYQDRTEYLSQFNAELCYMEAVEKLAGLEVPERSKYIRLILAELQRAASHFMFFGAFGVDIGIFGTSFMYAFRERENINDLFEEISGDRLMYSYFRPGGVAWDVPHNFAERVRWVCEQTEVGLSDLDRLLVDNEIFIERTRHVGSITPEEAISHGVTGPLLRATGFRYDLRKDQPYSIYDRFDFDIPVGQNGDCYDRFLVRMEEVHQSVRIVRQALEQMPATGPLLPKKLPRMLRPAAGEIYMPSEDPRGEYAVYIVSKGATQPYRIHMRSPSFCNLTALKRMTVGQYVADAITILGSLDIVLCSVDR